MDTAPTIRSRPIPTGLPANGTLLTEVKETSSGDILSHNLYYGADVGAYDHLRGTQITESYNHPAWRRRVRGHFPGDLGGPFSSRKRFVRTLSSSIGISSPWLYDGYNLERQTTYSGPYLPIAPSLMSYPPYADSQDSVLDRLGTEAISEVGPSNPIADLSVLLGETLKEGIPAIAGATLRKWRGMSGKELRNSIGHEYLNIEFGWKPLVRDLRKVSTVIRDRDALWAQYERDAGKLVRRKYGWPEDVTETARVVQQDCSPWISPSGGTLADPSRNNQGKVIMTDKVTIRRWFSGAFIYYFPVTESGRGTVAMNVIQAKKLLGLSLTPDTVWNLMPWTWALDWFANTGDIVNNWSNWAIDGQVLKYGYMMEHTVSERTYTFSGPSGYWGNPRPMDVTLVSETKRRRRATPYGFGLNFDGFSIKQQAIIAALGLSRS